MVLEPGKELLGLRELLGFDRRRALFELGDQRLRACAHLLPVTDRRMHLAQHALDVGAQLGEQRPVGLTGDLGVQDRLADRVLVRRA